MSEALEEEIRALRALYGSERDPEGRVFAPLADAFGRAGKVRQAIEVLNDGLERHPDFVSGHVVAARVYVRAGLTHEGELAARRALDLDPENVEALDTLAGALTARDAPDEAAAVRARLAALLPPADREREEPSRATHESVREERVPAVEAPGPGEAIDEIAPDEPVLAIEELAPEEPATADEEEGPGGRVVGLEAPVPDEPVVAIEELAPDEPVVAIDTLAPDGTVVAAASGDAPTAEEADDLPLPTRTLADLYARQGLIDEALAVYRRLLAASPGDRALEARIAEIEVGSGSDVGPAPAPATGDPGVTDSAWDRDAQGADPVTDTPFAWTATEKAEEPEVRADGPTVLEYFARLLEWTPGEPESGDGGAAAPPAGGTPSRDDDPFHAWINEGDG